MRDEVEDPPVADRRTMNWFRRDKILEEGVQQWKVCAILYRFIKNAKASALTVF